MTATGKPAPLTDAYDGIGRGPPELTHAEYVEGATAGLARRLRAQMTVWSGGGKAPNLRAFAAALEGVPGASRPMLLRYIRGDQIPPLTFLLAAAREMGLRLDWLLAGEGHPFEGPLLIEGEYNAQLYDMVFHGLMDGMSAEWAELIEEGTFRSIARQVNELAVQMLMAERKVLELADEDYNYGDVHKYIVRASHGIGMALGSSLQEWFRWYNPEKTAAIDPERLNRYILAVAPALLVVADADGYAGMMLEREFADFNLDVYDRPYGPTAGVHHIYMRNDGSRACTCKDFQDAGTCSRVEAINARELYPRALGLPDEIGDEGGFPEPAEAEDGD